MLLSSIESDQFQLQTIINTLGGVGDRDEDNIISNNDTSHASTTNTSNDYYINTYCNNYNGNDNNNGATRLQRADSDPSISDTISLRSVRSKDPLAQLLEEEDDDYY